MPKEEVDRRYGRIREAMARDGLDAVIVSGNEYTGFEGAVTYMSGFVIVHRYAYVLLPREGEPAIVFPREATYVGEHGTTWIDEQVFVDKPGEWLADQVRGKRVGVYGLDYVMTVRDYRALHGAAEIVPWDVEFDHARAVKSELELESVRDSVRINTEGFWIFLEHFAPGKSEREILAHCEKYFVEQGCGRLTMDMVLVGDGGAALPEFKIAGDYAIKVSDMVLPSLEIAGVGGHWVEVSRAICAGSPSTGDCADDGGIRGVLRRGAERAQGRRNRPRRPPRRLAGLPRPRLHARARDRPLDRDDDDRMAEDRRGRRDGVAREHDLLDAPARDLAGRQGLPLHAGHLAGDEGRRRAVGGPADEDLRRNGEPVMNELAKPILEGEGGSDYERYLRTDALLRLQKGADEWVHRDELLFQTVHQSSELWLKLAWNEVEEAGRLVAADDIAAANRLLRRASDCLKLVTSALDMLEHMSPWEYTEVRKVLGHGSGFDSPGFREIRRVAKPLGEAFHAAHERAGLTLVEVYTRGREFEDLYTLAEQLIEFDERVIVWRVRHFKVVQRVIGADVIGTQGTPVEVMGRLIHHSFYPELWDVRNELTRMNLPE